MSVLSRPHIHSVSTLLTWIKQTCQQHIGWIAVRGEVSNLKVARSGHMYFRLKDATGSIDAMIFRMETEQLYFTPADGMEVVAWGQCSMYAPQGRMQLEVELMEQVGVGTLAFAYERLRERLQGEGLLDPARKRRLPDFPKCIALITSPVGAALRDLLEVIRSRSRTCRLLLAPSRVQGAGAAESMAEMIRVVNQQAEVDLIILGRGGGTKEDLWPFNEEVLARAIAGSQIPVLTGIGHETDTSLADEVADMRAATPSAAAMVAVPEEALLRKQLLEGRRRLVLAMQQKLAQVRWQLGAWEQRLKPPASQLAEQRQRLEALSQRLSGAIQKQLHHKRERVERKMVQLDALSPLRVLERGYAWVTDEQGAIVRGEQVEIDQKLSIRLQEQVVEVVVTERHSLDGEGDR